MKTPLISLIIPHKNTPLLLQRLLSTVPDREEVQVIVVDDNSDADMVQQDSFPGFGRLFTEVLFTHEGRGAGYARNCGLEKALGEWLLFADSDDFFTDGAFGTLLQQASVSEADIVYFSYTSCDSDTLEPTPRFHAYMRYIDEFVANPSEYSENMLRFRHDIPWGKLIRRNLVESNGIQFDETRYCNDTIFSTRTAMTARHVEVCTVPIYCVTTREGSLVTQMSRQAVLIRLEVILRKNNLLNQWITPPHTHTHTIPFRLGVR